MSKLRSRGEEVRKFILQNVEAYPSTIAKVASEKFDISRQAINKHLQRLVEEESLGLKGNTKSRIYKLRPLMEWTDTFNITPDLAEHVIWRNEIQPRLGIMPDNVIDIWHYGFTEMFNNAIDHSGGRVILIQLSMSAINTQLALYDNGVGIFKKIQVELELLDERHSVLELTKGKLTTDPDRHSGEGIFFTSRMFDDFDIVSGSTYFSHKFGEKEDWILERDKFSSGTAVWMKLNNHTSRTSKKIFDDFTSGDDYGFSKTVVPVKVTQYGDDKLISRSQAKRLLVRFDRFKAVILDFEEVDSIGQAFADEVFRVFTKMHPEIELSYVNSNPDVERMIKRAISHT